MHACMRPVLIHNILCLFQFRNCLFVSVLNAKRHIINFLLTSLARSVQGIIGPRPFRTDLALRARSVPKTPRSDIFLYRPRARLIRSYYYAYFKNNLGLGFQISGVPGEGILPTTFCPIAGHFHM